jgi:succinyl-CoA synthetase beta subunit
MSELTPATLEATLTSYGITLPKSYAASSVAEAVSAAERIGFPVVLKISSRDIVHKTEAHGVAVGLQDGSAVEGAAELLLAGARTANANAQIDGFLVQEMVSGIEAIVGARSDPLYGPMLLVGSGGVLVELIKDAALRLLPVTADEVTTMVDGLKLARLLSGFRMQLPGDRAALEATALALGRFFLDHRARISDIEINPLMVRPKIDFRDPQSQDRGAVAVDVRVVWREDA